MPDTKQEQSAFDKWLRAHKGIGWDKDSMREGWDAALQAACEAVCYLCAEHKPVFQPKDDTANHCFFQHHWSSGLVNHMYTCGAGRIRALLSKPERK